MRPPSPHPSACSFAAPSCACVIACEIACVKKAPWTNIYVASCVVNILYYIVKWANNWSSWTCVKRCPSGRVLALPMWSLFLGLSLVCACAVTSLNRSVKPRSDLLLTPLAWKRSISSSQSSLSQTKYLTWLFHFGFDLLFVPSTLNYFSLCLKCVRCFTFWWKKKKKKKIERHKAEFLSSAGSVRVR